MTYVERVLKDLPFLSFFVLKLETNFNINFWEIWQDIQLLIVGGKIYKIKALVEGVKLLQAHFLYL